MTCKRTLRLNTGWAFKQTTEPDSTYLQVSQFPTNIHLDLLHHSLIPDPFVGKNENLVQWVGEKAWTYRVEFETPHFHESENIDLVFEGLDTHATVFVNRVEVLKTDNMFIPERVAVKELVKPGEGSVNLMEIRFDSTYLIGEKIKAENPEHRWVCWNGESSRLAVRKAQYHYGWDWGPSLLTCGPWRPVALEVYSSRLEDLDITYTLSSSFDVATVEVKVSLINAAAGNIQFSISTATTTILTATEDANEGTEDANEGLNSHTFTLPVPQLWYPAGYGNQHLYTVSAKLIAGEKQLDVISRRVGFRSVKLIEDKLKDAPGTSFFFKVNGIPIFAGGSNWIPADSFIPRLSKQKYRDWLNLVKEGNQTMIRVWGGGIYEEEVFYDTADELGLLCWQDFAFGCGNYPTMPSLLESIEREAVSNVKRLRHHPSIVIYAGNNEDYQVAESQSLTFDQTDTDPNSWLKTNFPARYIYEKILPDVMAKYLPSVAYRVGSPFGGAVTSDPTVGDIHQWGVWHGQMENYQNFDKLAGRFVSEFGMAAYPSMKTIEKFVPSTSFERHPYGSTLSFHNKAGEHERRIATYLVENIRYAITPLSSFIYATQLMQAECLAAAYRLWRRNWRGPGREYTAGVLVWQLNDCWPSISWAIVDHYLNPKPAYFAIRQSLERVVVAAKRKTETVGGETRTAIEIWASNFFLEDVEATLLIEAFDVVSGKKLSSEETKLHHLPPNRSTDLLEFLLPDIFGIEKSDVVVALYLRGTTGAKLARFISWHEPLKEVNVQVPKSLLTEQKADGLALSSDVPVKGLFLEGDDVKFKDNFIDLVPGEIVKIQATGLSGKKLDVKYYGSCT